MRFNDIFIYARGTIAKQIYSLNIMAHKSL